MLHSRSVALPVSSLVLHRHPIISIFLFFLPFLSLRPPSLRRSSFLFIVSLPPRCTLIRRFNATTVTISIRLPFSLLVLLLSLSPPLYLLSPLGFFLLLPSCTRSSCPSTTSPSLSHHPSLDLPASLSLSLSVSSLCPVLKLFLARRCTSDEEAQTRPALYIHTVYLPTVRLTHPLSHTHTDTLREGLRDDSSPINSE